MTALFLSHGSPTTILDVDTSAHRFLREIGPSLADARAFAVVSGHWVTGEVRASAAARPETIYDFYGFPDAFYALSHPAEGAPALAERSVALLTEAGLPAALDPRRGLDHGAWMPLSLIDPAARIPAFQISLLHRGSPAAHLALGRALRPLSEDGVAIIGSGTMTHNLRLFRTRDPMAPADPKARAFAEWMALKLEAGDLDALLDYRVQAPDAALHHPTDEHLMPLYVALGAAGEGARAKRIHESMAYAILSMDAYAFEAAA